MPTPLRFVLWEDLDYFRKPRTESLGQLVEWWLEAVESGAWRWDRVREQWQQDSDLLNEDYRKSGLT
jgi:hypothetical protein